MSRPGTFLIAQLSDIHCGDKRYDQALETSCLETVRQAEPDLVLVPGDLTADGYAEEFSLAHDFLSRLPCPWFAVPGNHDERNVGWRTYERLFGSRWHAHEMAFGVPSVERPCADLRLVACDSAEPDLNDGELGRVRHAWIRDRFEGADQSFRVLMLHHHIVTIPNTGRERNVLHDAGDVLETLVDVRVDLVLAGHKHVPYVWVVNGVPIVTSGTATTWRVRGETPPSLNLIEIAEESVTVRTMWTAGGKPTGVRMPRRP